MSDDTNPKQAYGDLKIPLHLVPPALMIGAARAFREGAAKYGPYNWRTKKVELMTYIGAIQRHLAALLDGEDSDPESTAGKLHLDGIAASVAIALDAHHGGFLVDNRPPKGPAPGLVRTPGLHPDSAKPVPIVHESLPCGDHWEGDHPDRANYLQGAAERNGPVCRQGWAL